jgi:hypothetical protein
MANLTHFGAVGFHMCSSNRCQKRANEKNVSMTSSFSFYILGVFFSVVGVADGSVLAAC